LGSEREPRTVCGYSARLRRIVTLVILNDQYKNELREAL